MSVISQGFRTMYEIIELGTIKPGASGKMDNGADYKASVKFRSKNVVERMNPKVGIQEIETTLEYVIPCETEEEAILVSEALRKLRTLKLPFYINGDLPVKYDRQDVPFVKSFDNGAVFLKSVETLINPKTKA